MTSRKLPYLALSISALFLLAGPALADGCTTSGATPIPLGVAGTFYVTTACDPGTCTFGVWVYEESNQKGGLQRNDSGRDDTENGGCYAPDRRIL